MAKEVDYLIVGQGIAGTWMSYHLEKEGKSFIVYDDEKKNAASRIAAGIINPVTGRRYATVWKAAEVVHSAWESYNQIGHDLNVNAISQRNIIDFFPSPQMLLSFTARVEEKNQYLHSYPEQNQFNPYLNYEFGCGEIRPVYIVHNEVLLPAWRRKLEAKDQIRSEKFDFRNVEFKKDHIVYNDIQARKVIFCEGAGSEAPWFSLLPHAPNKGEALLLDIPELPAQHIFKHGMMLVPMAEEGKWWLGSDYAWEFKDDQPTNEFLSRSKAILDKFLKLEYRITDHLSGVRPATLERRPFVGIHPHTPGIAILNGLGTKGCSLAPYFAKQLTDQLVYDLPIDPEADVQRFSRVLSR